MRLMTTKELWPSASGILDLQTDWATLADSGLSSLRDVWVEQRSRLKDSEQLRIFTDKLKRAWSIETGIIENIYDIDRGVTQLLIEHGFRSEILEQGATNKPKDYVLRTLQAQEDVINGLFDFVKGERELTVGYIKEMHAAMLRNQTHVDGVDSDGSLVQVPLEHGQWKSVPNFPERGTRYLYCPPEQVASEMDRLVEMHNQHEEVSPEVEAAWLHHSFSVIHPFADGNGRVARALASLVLIKSGLFPLVVTRDDKADYLDSLEQADTGDLRPLIKFIASLQRIQFRQAIAISEGLLTDKSSVKQALEGLALAAKKKAEERAAKLRNVFDLAEVIEKRATERLEGFGSEIESTLRNLDPHARATVSRSTPADGYYFRGQIIEIAKNHLNYRAEFGDYRSWVRLRITWTRRAQAVFAIHGTGYEFAGVLVVAPFLEFRDDEGDDDAPRSTLVNLAREPFEFFYNESPEVASGRFDEWLDHVLTTLAAELAKNL